MCIVNILGMQGQYQCTGGYNEVLSRLIDFCGEICILFFKIGVEHWCNKPYHFGCTAPILIFSFLFVLCLEDIDSNAALCQLLHFFPFASMKDREEITYQQWDCTQIFTESIRLMLQYWQMDPCWQRDLSYCLVREMSLLVPIAIQGFIICSIW